VGTYQEIPILKLDYVGPWPGIVCGEYVCLVSFVAIASFSFWFAVSSEVYAHHGDDASSMLV
tara:strand:+ start:162 stop:347 length:186 start_codon:yes stop_codon:yes gene_type:complete